MKKEKRQRRNMAKAKKLRRQQRQQEESFDNQVQKKPKLTKFYKVLIGICFLAVTVIFVWQNSVSPPTSSEEAKQNKNIQFQPLPQFVDENKSAFAKPADITTKTTLLIAEKPNDPLNLARINLLCAKGLPHSQDIDIEKCLDILKKMASQVKRETSKYLCKYKNDPKDYYNSEAYFRMLTLITVLQQDFGVKYNPDLIEIVS